MRRLNLLVSTFVCQACLEGRGGAGALGSARGLYYVNDLYWGISRNGSCCRREALLPPRGRPAGSSAGAHSLRVPLPSELMLTDEEIETQRGSDLLRATQQVASKAGVHFQVRVAPEPTFFLLYLGS